MAKITRHLTYKLDSFFNNSREHTLTERAVAKTLFEYDPSRLNFGDNYLEYVGEAKELITKWDQCNSAAEITELITRMLEEWLGDDWRYNKEFTDEEFNKMASAIYSLRQTILQ